MSRRWSILPVVAVIGLVPLAAPAQDLSLPNTLRLPVSREFDQQLGRASRFEEEERWEEAARVYEALLEANRDPEHGNRIHQIGDHRYRGISAVVHDRLTDWPAEAIEAYREQVDVAARARLGEAVESGDEEALLGLVHDHPVSTAAIDGHLVLADRAIEEGDFISARRFIDRALAIPGADPDAPANLLRRAVCALYGGEPDRAREMVAPLVEDDELEEDRRAMARRVRRRAEEARAAGDDVPGGLPPIGDRWPVVAGTPSGRAHVAEPFAFGDLRWRFSHGGRTLPSGETEVRPAGRVQPVVSGSRAVLATGQPVHAVDVDTGDILWQGMAPDGGVWRQRVPREGGGSASIARDLLFGGAISGHRVVAPMLREIDEGEDYRRIPITEDLPFHKLGCFDLVTGKLLWDHGLWNAEDASSHLAQSSFPSPPVVADGVAYAGSWKQTGFVDSAVWAFDVRTGEALWRSWICSGQVEQTMFGEWARPPLCSTPTVSGGRVYHSTSFGAVSAVEARTGRIEWVALYDQIEVEAASGYNPRYRGLRWRNHPPVVLDGVVVVAPLDSNHVYGFDAETGARLWRIDGSQFDHDLDTIVGAGTVDGEAMIVFGGDRLRAIEVDGGKFVWPLPERQIDTPVTGRGIVAGDLIYVPCRDAIQRYDLATGERHESIPWPRNQQPGSLTVVGRTLLVVSDHQTTAYRLERPDG